MIEPRSLPNPSPTVDQLLTLANRAGRKTLSSAEISTLRRGIEALAEAAVLAAGGVAPPRQVSHRPSRQLVETQQLLDVAVRLYADAYGLSVGQALGEVRAEAGR